MHHTLSFLFQERETTLLPAIKTKLLPAAQGIVDSLGETQKTYHFSTPPQDYTAIRRDYIRLYSAAKKQLSFTFGDLL